MQKFEKLIKLTHGHTHAKIECPKLAAADINQDHSLTTVLAAVTSLPALSVFASVGFTGIGVISETTL